MAAMSYGDAREKILETSVMGGYTMRSKDRLWLIVTIDEDASENRSFKSAYGNWLFLTEHKQLAYELADDVLVFTRLHEADSYVWTELAGTDIARYHAFYTLNRGDDSRWEEFILGMRPNGNPKFRGSVAAQKRMTEIQAATPEGFGRKAAWSH